MGGQYDLEAIRSAHSLSDVIGRWVKLKRQGREYVGLSPFNKERSPSFTVCEDKGFWHDFSSGKHGDLFDFICETQGVSLPDACAILGGEKVAPLEQLTPREKPRPEVVIVAAEIPDTFEGFQPRKQIKAWNPSKGEAGGWSTYVADYVWPYHAPNGDLMGYVIRINLSDGGKLIIPLRPAMWGDEVRWTAHHFDKPRPLYNAHILPASGSVLLVEGEKDADAGTRMLGKTVTAWPGGTNAVAYVDFSPLQGRDVVLWLDADEPGEKASQTAAAALMAAGARGVSVVPWDKDRAKGWGAADLEDEGGGLFDVQDIMTTAVQFEWDGAAAEPEPDEPVTETPSLFAKPFEWADPETLPKRQWLYGRHLIRRFVSITIAPGGLGKSSLLLVEALAMASGKNLLGDYVPHPLRVGYWNGEDPESENRYRITAAACHHKLKPEDFAERLFLDTGREQKIVVATQGRDGVEVNWPDIARLEQAITDNRLDVVILDPFISAHAVNENDNGAIQMVVQALVDVAERCNCAIELVHHIRKPGSGINQETSVDDARGASALLGKARSARVLNSMTQDEAAQLKIDNRLRYFRVDNGKANLAPRTDKAAWRHMASFDLGNADDNGETDEIGVVEKWDLPADAVLIPPDAARIAQRLVVHSEYRADAQSADWLGYPLAVEFDLNPTDKNHVIALKKFLDHLVANRTLLIEMRKDKQRKMKPFLLIGESLDD